MTDIRNPVGTKEQREKERELLVCSTWTYRMKQEALDGLDIAQEMADMLRALKPTSPLAAEWAEWKGPE